MPNLNIKKLWRRKSVAITESDPTYKVIYLGNVLTGWAKGDGCVEKPLATLWRSYCQSSRPDIAMKVTICGAGLRAVTRDHGLTEYWAHRVTHCAAHDNYPRVFCWVYRHEGRRLKQELRCHAVVCPKQGKAEIMSTQLKERLASALHEFRREKTIRQNARLSPVHAVYDSLPMRKASLITGSQNYRPPLERSKSAPKLGSIEEIEEEEYEDEKSEVRSSCSEQRLQERLTVEAKDERLRISVVDHSSNPLRKKLEQYYGLRPMDKIRELTSDPALNVDSYPLVNNDDEGESIGCSEEGDERLRPNMEECGTEVPESDSCEHFEWRLSLFQNHAGSPTRELLNSKELNQLPIDSDAYRDNNVDITPLPFPPSISEPDFFDNQLSDELSKRLFDTTLALMNIEDKLNMESSATGDDVSKSIIEHDALDEDSSNGSLTSDQVESIGSHSCASSCSDRGIINGDDGDYLIERGSDDTLLLKGVKDNMKGCKDHEEGDNISEESGYSEDKDCLVHAELATVREV